MTEIRLEKSLPSEQERVGQPSVPAEGLERYFAREGVDPLPYAFDGKIAVHPGLGGSGVEKQDFEAGAFAGGAEDGKDRGVHPCAVL